MIPILLPEQLRSLDVASCERLGEIALMRAAGTRIATCIDELLPRGGRVLAFAGPGNNGGDAFAALAALGKQHERVVLELPVGKRSAARSDAQERATASGVRTIAWTETEARDAALARAELFVDGLYGTGARLPLDVTVRDAVAAIVERTLPCVAIDMPTGLDARTGAVPGIAVRAHLTVALGALAPAHLLDPARDFVGRLVLADIGFPPELLAAIPPRFVTFDGASARAAMPQRDERADKRSAGSLLAIAGSAQFPGAAVLCARAAARAGAGYVTVAAPASALASLRAHLIEEIVVEIPADLQKASALLRDLETRHRALAIGPGLGLSDDIGELVRERLATTNLPAVVDASALFHLAKHLDILRGRAAILTPHEGEFARLSGEGSVRPGTRVERLRAFVERSEITTLLKGRDTLVDDGSRSYINPSGTNALATAGSGDVLTGIVGALLARGCTPFQAGALAAFWHGRAGQAAQRQREIGVVASDIIESLGNALR
ncbi:MAG: NAD(P)H-hydrate dehydratase [Candidatus Eremiobacteraeota bacterium]|nr:NAD(P)H-hydrate dehydratase [Candidatus Eremiobacteraeota bacterium]